MGAHSLQIIRNERRQRLHGELYGRTQERSATERGPMLRSSVPRTLGACPAGSLNVNENEVQEFRMAVIVSDSSCIGACKDWLQVMPGRREDQRTRLYRFHRVARVPIDASWQICGLHSPRLIGDRDKRGHGEGCWKLCYYIDFSQATPSCPALQGVW